MLFKFRTKICCDSSPTGQCWSHGSEMHPEIVLDIKEGDWKTKMMYQPSRSPDMNILELGIFSSIQAMQYKCPTNDNDSLIRAVENAFNNVPSQTIDKCFLTL